MVHQRKIEVKIGPEEFEASFKLFGFDRYPSGCEKRGTEAFGLAGNEALRAARLPVRRSFNPSRRTGQQYDAERGDIKAA